jgi:hypothetical protein
MSTASALGPATVAIAPSPASARADDDERLEEEFAGIGAPPFAYHGAATDKYLMATSLGGGRLNLISILVLRDRHLHYLLPMLLIPSIRGTFRCRQIPACKPNETRAPAGE